MSDSNSAAHWQRRHEEFLAKAQTTQDQGLASIYRAFATEYGRAAARTRSEAAEAIAA